MNAWNALVGYIRNGPWRISFARRFISTGYVKPVSNELLLMRKDFTDHSTIGELHLDGELFCYTLERSCRKTAEAPLAIPCGKYELEITFSPRMQKPLPLVVNVPGRTGIRIHCANYPGELQGCIALGMRKDVDVIYDSKLAFSKFFPELEKRLKTGKVTLSIVGGG